MTTHWLVAATCLVAAAVVLGWPRRSRQTRLLTSSHPATTSLKGRVESLSGPRALILAIALTALTGTLVAGPVAGVVAGGYGAIAVRTVLRRRAAQATAAMRTRSLDALCGLAADLRAGLPASGPTPVGSTTVGSTQGRLSLPEPASLDGLSDPAPGPSAVEDHRMARLAGAAWRLAERTGAPIADLIERIEADARAMDRASAAAAAQAAGARATAWLLAGLPVGGIALGYSIGADPLAVLLHTPIGAACAVGAIVLQVAGLAWADRIASVGTARPEPAPPPADAPTPTPPPWLGAQTTPTPAGSPLPSASSGVASTPVWPPLPSALPGVASAPAGSPLPSGLPGGASTPTWPPLPSALSSTPTWRPSPPETPGAAPTTAPGEAPAMPLWPTPAPTTPSAGSPWRTVPKRPVPAAASAAGAPQTGPARPPVTPKTTPARGQAPAPSAVPTKAPLRKAGGTGPTLRSGAAAQAESPEAARTPARPKPYPLPRAAANQRGAAVADPPSPGSDA